MADSPSHLHAIFIPMNLQGHLNPSVQLAIKLAQKGFTITFLIKEGTNRLIKKASETSQQGEDDIFSRIRSSFGLDIRYVTMSDGVPQNFDRRANPEQALHSFIYEYDAYVDEVVGKVVDSNSRSVRPVNVLIADTFYPWISKIARKYELVFVSFWTQPALNFSIHCYLHLLRQNGHVYCQEKREDAVDYIPGVKSIEPKDLLSHLHQEENSTLMHKMIFTAFEDVKHNADFVLCNTIQELEPDTISALQSTVISFYAIGPILPSNVTKSLVPTSFWTETSCSQWLDKKPRDSVLYISFGSLARLSKDDILEIAYGLLHSNIDFIWVLRPGIGATTSNFDSSDLLPAEVRTDLLEHGLIVPWSDQITLLSHPAIGGFLTHCGWNSILERAKYRCCVFLK